MFGVSSTSNVVGAHVQLPLLEVNPSCAVYERRGASVPVRDAAHSKCQAHSPSITHGISFARVGAFAGSESPPRAITKQPRNGRQSTARSESSRGTSALESDKMPADLITCYRRHLGGWHALVAPFLTTSDIGAELNGTPLNDLGLLASLAPRSTAGKAALKTSSAPTLKLPYPDWKMDGVMSCQMNRYPGRTMGTVRAKGNIQRGRLKC